MKHRRWMPNEYEGAGDRVRKIEIDTKQTKDVARGT